MKSILKKSLAVVMVLSMLLSLAMPVFAANMPEHVLENQPCEHAGVEGAITVDHVEANCVQNGGDWHTCTVCGRVWVENATAKLDPEDPKSHKLSTTASSKPATCQEEGYEDSYKCTVEGCSYTEGGAKIPKFVHKKPADCVAGEKSCLVLDEEKSTSKTCLSEGVQVYKCNFADDALVNCKWEASKDNGGIVENKTSGHAHTLVTTDYQAPTCVDMGWVTLQCSACGASETVQAASVGHTWQDVEALPSTCNLAGYYEGGYCTAWWLTWNDGVATKVTCDAYYLGATEPESDNDESILHPVDGDKDKESLRHEGTAQHPGLVAILDAENNPITMPDGTLSFKAPQCNPDLSEEEQKGWQWYECTAKCGYTVQKELTADHVKDPTVDPLHKNPTCTEDGYDKYQCLNCGKVCIEEKIPASHNYAADKNKEVFYTFVKDGKIYMGDAVEDKALVAINPDETVVVYRIDSKPYITTKLTDAKAVELLNENYEAIAWNVQEPAECGETGLYSRACKSADCNKGENLYVTMQHNWNQVEPEYLEATCTTPGGYKGMCALCGTEYFLGETEGYANTYVEALQHMNVAGNKCGIEKNDDVTVFIPAHADAQNSTCVDYGWNEFDYCEREGCDLPNYEEAKAANLKSELAEHTFWKVDSEGEFVTDDKGNKVPAHKIKVDPSCTNKGYWIAACSVCQVSVSGNVPLFKDRIVGTEFGAPLPKDAWESHMWTEDGSDPIRVESTKPTCDNAGQYLDIQCLLCNVPSNFYPAWDDKLADEKLQQKNPNFDEFEYVDGMTTGVYGDDNQWYVTVQHATCSDAGFVTLECNYCKNNGTTTHLLQDITPEVGFEPTEDHRIDGAIYIEDENGYVMDGDYYVVDKSVLDIAQVPPEGKDPLISSPTCDWEDKGGYYYGYHKCASCEESILFTVRIDHTPNTSDPKCEEEVVCTECPTIIEAATPHQMAVLTDAEGNAICSAIADNNCMVAFYKHIYCTVEGCEKSSQNDDFDWADYVGSGEGEEFVEHPWRDLAKYREAMEAHNFNVENPTCMTNKFCQNLDGACVEGFVAAVGHNNDVNYAGEYTVPTCNKKGYTTFTCEAGANCDMVQRELATLVDGNAVWVVEDQDPEEGEYEYADHSFKLYIEQERSCLHFGVIVNRCEYCNAAHEVEYLQDATGHELVELKVDSKCNALGYVQNVCKNCFNISLECADPKHDATNCAACKDIRNDTMHTIKDWKNDLGYDYLTAQVIELKPHFYTPVAGEAPVTFLMNCMEALKLRVEVIDETTGDFLGYAYPTCEAGCDQTLSPDMHDISDVKYTQDATCTMPGLGYGKCVVVGCTHREIEYVKPALGHTDVYWNVTKQANCCETGIKVLACRDCKDNVKVGEVLNVIPADFGVAASTPYTVEDEALLTRTIEKGECTFTVKKSESAATIHSEGAIVWECSYNANGHDCPETQTQVLPKLDVVELSAEIDNAVKPGHNVYVNGGKIAYTISIDAENKDIYALQLKLAYDAKYLTYVGFDLGADNANIFGAFDRNCATQVGSQVVEGEDGALNGTVSVIGNVPNTEDGEIVNVTVNDKQVLVVLYFDINANTITDLNDDKGYITKITIEEILVTDYNNEVDPSLALEGDHATTAVQADAIRVEKLGDVNTVKDGNGNTYISDGMINIYDVKYVQKLILAKDYDARADINQDGVINGFDMVAIQKYIIYKHTYAEMVSK